MQLTITLSIAALLPLSLSAATSAPTYAQEVSRIIQNRSELG